MRLPVQSPIRWILIALLAAGASAARAQPQPPSFTLNLLSMGGPLAWSDTTPIVAALQVGPVAATGVDLNAVLTDDATNERFAGGGLRICAEPTGTCTPVTALPANQTTKVFLRLRDDATPPAAGKYVGTVEFYAKEGKASAGQLTITVTSWPQKIVGMALIALGLLLSFGFTIGVRNGLLRAQLLAPAAELRDRLGELQARLTALSSGFETPLISGLLRTLRDQLSDKALEGANFVPGVFAPAFSPQANATLYQQFLDRVGAWSIALQHIIGQGLKPLAQMSTATVPDTQKPAIGAAFAAAVKTIDGLAAIASPSDGPQPIANIDQAIGAALDAVKTALANAKVPPVGGAVPVVSDSDHLRFQISVLSLALWVYAGLLSWVAGSFLLVLNHLDFGRPWDYAWCLGWGLGLPAASQLAQATPTTISASLGVTLAKQ